MWISKLLEIALELVTSSYCCGCPKAFLTCCITYLRSSQLLYCEASSAATGPPPMHLLLPNPVLCVHCCCRPFQISPPLPHCCSPPCRSPVWDLLLLPLQEPLTDLQCCRRWLIKKAVVPTRTRANRDGSRDGCLALPVLPLFSLRCSHFADFRPWQRGHPGFFQHLDT